MPSQKASEIQRTCQTAEVPVERSAKVASAAAVHDAQARDFGLLGNSLSRADIANGNTARNPTIHKSDSPVFRSWKFAAIQNTALTVSTYATAETAVTAMPEPSFPRLKPSFQCFERARLHEAENPSRTKKYAAFARVDTTKAKMNASKKKVAFPNAQKKTENAKSDFAYAAFNDHWEKSSQTTATAATVQETGVGTPWKWRAAHAHAASASTVQRTQSGTSDFFASVHAETAATVMAAAKSA